MGRSIREPPSQKLGMGANERRSTRYSLVKGERIVRFELNPRHPNKAKQHHTFSFIAFGAT